MQITKQVDRAIVDLRFAKKDELTLVAEALLEISEVISIHGLTMIVRPISSPTHLDISTRSQ